MAEYYILDGRTPVPASMMAWAVWHETSRESRRVAKTEGDGWTVSTVFLGSNHQFGDGPPLLFETLVFDGPFDQHMDRCSTWGEAESMHDRFVTACKAGIEP